MTRHEPKPLPIRTAETSTFFDKAKCGELMLQHCNNCNEFNLSGYRYCPSCFFATEWQPSEGLGRISSFAIVRESSHAGFRNFVPYAVAEVTLSEGPILNLRVVGCEPEDVFIGQRVKVDFVDDESGESTPVWRVLFNR